MNIFLLFFIHQSFCQIYKWLHHFFWSIFAIQDSVYKRNTLPTGCLNSYCTRCVSGGKKHSFFRKIWRALYSCYLRFEIRPFAILPAIRERNSLLNHLTSNMSDINDRLLLKIPVLFVNINQKKVHTVHIIFIFLFPQTFPSWVINYRLFKINESQ